MSTRTTCLPGATVTGERHPRIEPGVGVRQQKELGEVGKRRFLLIVASQRRAPSPGENQKGTE